MATPPRKQKPTFTVGGGSTSTPTSSSAGPSPRLQLDASQIYVEDIQEPWKIRVGRFIYNKQNNTFCGKTCFGWGKIILYSISFITILAVYACSLLFLSLALIQHSNLSNADVRLKNRPAAQLELKTVGLTGTPLALHTYPLITYQSGESPDYEMYLSDISKFLKGKPANSLGPCGTSPYGFGESPCVILKVNKQKDWYSKPLKPGSARTKQAPDEVQRWVHEDSSKFWVHCHGYYNYDKEHIGKIKYYPDPPGIDSKLFPLDVKNDSPLVAVQVSGFTLGLSIAVRCSLWYESGVSDIDFVLYVTPKGKLLRNLSTW